MQLPVTIGTETEIRECTLRADIWCRAGTYDEFVVREIIPTYGWMPVACRRVMDIGGNIGAFAAWAASAGAEHVVTVEPELSNYRTLLENTRQHERIEALRAMVGSETMLGAGEIWLSPTGKNPGNTSSVHMRGRTGQTGIDILGFMDIMEEYEPEVLKIDVEGAEYDFLTSPLPDHVRYLTMEIHLSRPVWRQEKGPAVAALFSSWECVRAPKFEGGHWNTIGAWKR